MSQPAIQFGDPANLGPSRPRRRRGRPRAKAEILATAARNGQLCLCPRCVAENPERAELLRQGRRDLARRFGSLRQERDL